MTPVGLLVGEAPGPLPYGRRLPLFPTATSAGGRLMSYAEVTAEEWFGRLRRTNLCPGGWARETAEVRAKELRLWCLQQEVLPRVLLLGVGVRDAWGIRSTATFGYTERGGLEVAWVPHPSARLIYRHTNNRLKARRAVLWAMGGRSQP